MRRVRSFTSVIPVIAGVTLLAVLISLNPGSVETSPKTTLTAASPSNQAFLQRHRAEVAQRTIAAETAARAEADRVAAEAAAQQAADEEAAAQQAAAAKKTVKPKSSSSGSSHSPVYADSGGGTPGERIKQCESGGDYSLKDSNGHYGAWQFSPSTWNETARSAGRSDLVGVNPADASPADQDSMAAHLWNGGRGSGQWECK